MRACKKYKQLKLSIEPLKDHYHRVMLSFKINNQDVKGMLNGNYKNWDFKSASRAFLKQIPSGVLCKYSIWVDTIPEELSQIYNAIWAAAHKAGYDLHEKEEAG